MFDLRRQSMALFSISIIAAATHSTNSQDNVPLAIEVSDSVLANLDDAIKDVPQDGFDTKFRCFTGFMISATSRNVSTFSLVRTVLTDDLFGSNSDHLKVSLSPDRKMNYSQERLYVVGRLHRREGFPCPILTESVVLGDDYESVINWRNRNVECDPTSELLKRDVEILDRLCVRGAEVHYVRWGKVAPTDETQGVVELSVSGIGDDDVQILGELTNCKKLKVEGVYEALAGLEDMEQLNSLTLVSASFNGRSLKVVSGFPSLKCLNLQSAIGTNEIASLEGNNTIAILHLPANGSVQMDIFEVAASMPNLKVLIASNAGLTDDKLKKIDVSPKLKYLDISGNQVSRKGLQALVDRSNISKVTTGTIELEPEQAGGEEKGDAAH